MQTELMWLLMGAMFIGDACLEFLEQIGVRADHTHSAVRETVLKPGDRVTVFGLAFLEPDATAPSTGFRSPPLVRHLRGQGQRPVMLGPADEKTQD